MEFIRDVFAIPFGWLLSIFYNLTDSYILAIVLLTILIRAALLPTSISQQKNTAKQTRLNTKVNKIKQKYAGNQQKIQEETQALYQREGFGAANMGCMPLMIQMIVMIGLYGVIYTPLSSVLRFGDDTIEKIKTAMNIVVETGKNNANNSRMIELQILGKVEEFADKLSGVIDSEQVTELLDFKERFTVFGLDLSLTPNPKEPGIIWIIPILAFVTAMASSLYMYARQKKQNPTMAKNPTMGCMTFMSPMMSLWFTFMFPAGVGFYWIISNILSFIQQVILTNVYSPRKVLAQQMVDETVVRRSKENNTKMRIDIEKK
ncbi:MAG: YidC/Oxa1 family membrane protein insertase [Acutalibacteraceae bacterium]|nr:YidC/Oxa1 family membrane protein insertase [Acutalibacteraceae bacterium]